MTTAQQVFKLVHMEIDATFRALYGPGRVFQWRTGKFKGRRCVVTQMFWEYKVDYWTKDAPKEPVFIVWVLLKTANKRGDGFMDEGSNFSRTYQQWTKEDFAIVLNPMVDPGE